MKNQKLTLLLSGLMLLSACGAPGEATGSVGFAAPVSSSASVAVEASSADDTPATVGTITLGGDSITVSGNGATVNGTTVTITQPGNYDISGELSDGQIIVDAGKEDNVYLTLSGASITCSEEFWNSMTANQQAAFKQAADEAGAFFRENMRADEQTILDQGSFEVEEIDPSSDFYKEMKEKAVELWAGYASQYPSDIMDRINQDFSV